MRFDIEKVLATAPIVTCPGCKVEMVMRDLEAVPQVDAIIRATYRCPTCGTDTKREFVATA